MTYKILWEWTSGQRWAGSHRTLVYGIVWFGPVTVEWYR